MTNSFGAVTPVCTESPEPLMLTGVPPELALVIRRCLLAAGMGTAVAVDVINFCLFRTPTSTQTSMWSDTR